MDLRRHFFTEKEHAICSWGGLTAELFLYPSGVPGVRVRNERGYFVVLPYNGQMVWEAVFDGRDLKMVNQFPEPFETTVLVENYGAFLAHCGARRMGTPTAEDDHPLHGELPCAPYQEAFLTFGSEGGRRWLGVGGVYHYKRGFGDYYDATPEVRLFEDGTMLGVTMKVQNLSNYPMDLMYMCHCNFLAGADTRIVQTCGWNTDDMILRTSIPSHVKPTQKFLDFLKGLESAPEMTARLRPEDEYDPEIVFFLRNVRTDERGFAHFMQVFPDGFAHSVSYQPESLPYHVRWILKDKNQQVLGILPATSECEGYVTEKKKGTVRVLPAGETAVFQVSAGLLSPREAAEREKLIERAAAPKGGSKS